MSIRERILSVFKGETPDVVPCMLDLSHWFYHKERMPWDISRSYIEPERELIDYHKKVGVGFYVPNLGHFLSAEYGNGVVAETNKKVVGGNTEIVWRLTTPIGSIERRRIWEERSYSWAIREWGVKSEQDLRVLAYALASRRYKPHWDRYRAWVDYVGEDGVVCLLTGYSAMGYLLCLWMGIEGTVYAIRDWPDTVREVIDRINRNNLQLVDLLAESPAEIILMGDNISSDIQPPHFFKEWSSEYYTEAVRRLHAAGKQVAVHIDGKLRGALAMVRDTGADSADAVTPAPMGDLTPRECREEAGSAFILSGGVPPDVWLPEVSVEAFKKSVTDWLDLKRYGPGLIAAAGDQVPPGAQEDRIEIMRDLVEEYGRY